MGYTGKEVVPLVGTWIEINTPDISWQISNKSFPLWERGLKSSRTGGSWSAARSFPLWERGLKFGSVGMVRDKQIVVPLVGTWIEIAKATTPATEATRRSPCGNVD